VNIPCCHPGFPVSTILRCFWQWGFSTANCFPVSSSIETSESVPIATHALRARPNLRAVQKLLSHSSVTTTQRYAHMDADDLRRQVAELPANRFSHTD